MPIRFSQGDIARLLRHFNLQPAGKGSGTFLGVGRDGVLRRCYFHYHADAVMMATGTADAIASQLGFKNAAEMKEYMDKHL